MQKLAVVSHRPTVREHVEVPKKIADATVPAPCDGAWITP